MGGPKISKAEADRYGSAAWNFFEKQKKFKAVQAKFNAIKEEFESEMEGLFANRQHNSISITNHNLADGEPNIIKVTKVERTTVEWDVAKLKKRLPKSVLKKVLRKEYRVIGMSQLVKYLQSCGVDPNIFKQYIDVVETVDQAAIDQAGELGEITVQQINGCYTVDCQKPYFKVNLSKGKGNG